MNWYYESLYKEAGRFEPPPMMVKDIRDWVSSIILLRKAKETIVENNEQINSYKLAIEEMSKKTSLSDSQNRFVELYKKDIEKLSKENENAIQEFLSKGERFGVNVDFLEKAEEVEWIRWFHLNLEGWRYFTEIKRLVNQNANREFNPQSYALQGYMSIKVELLFQENNSQWDDYSRTITIYVNENSDISQAMNSVYHEVSHMGQSIFSAVLNVRNIAGRPSKKIQTPEFKQWFEENEEKMNRVIEKSRKLGLDVKPGDFHSLDDIEFYTDLDSSIDLFKFAIKTGDLRFNKNELKYLIEVWIGTKKVNKFESNKLGRFFSYFHKDYFPNHFFAVLKRVSPAKWKKAVKEFVKANPIES